MRIFSLLLFALPTLENTQWRLAELNGTPQSSPPGTRQIFIRLDPANKTFTGFAGCNTVHGGFILNGNALKFSDVMSTMMACPSLDIEKSFTKALNTTTNFKVTDTGLALEDETGKTLARFTAEEPWDKVIAIASGTDVRFTRKSATGKPVIGVFDSADAERVIVVVKNEQMAVPRSDIQTFEARPKGGSRMTSNSSSTQNMPMDRPPAANPAERMKPTPPNSTSSTSSGISFGSKPGFELVYRARP